jgi:hypothetical protein
MNFSQDTGSVAKSEQELLIGEAVLLPGGGMMLVVNGLADWRYTLERRESLTEGEWQPVPGQADILSEIDGPLLLSDPAVLPQAFYRVMAIPWLGEQPATTRAGASPSQPSPIFCGRSA